MRYAFTFDASACTGCKACQVACKDKNGLPAGLLWRHVYEVSGGDWERQGAAWTNTVFAYNVSIACNHCAVPACAAACPTGACTVRDDGIVWIDGARCAGCEYCAWACPYSAPKYSHDLRRMTKCDFCRDLVDEGFSPACVAACPMRALDVTQVADDPVAPTATSPYPLPAFSRTEPQLVITPHVAMGNTLAKQVSNYEEVRPPKPRRALTIAGHHVEDVPLVLFTLLGQAAAGTAIISAIAGWLSARLLVTIGVLTALAAFASLLHLGNVAQAWRAPSHPRTSALSREVVALIVFAAAWLLTWLAPAAGRVPLAVCGLTLVYAMAEVYALDAVPAWSAARTRAAFALSALLLGSLTVLAASRPVPAWSGGLLAVGVFGVEVARRWRFYEARRGGVM